MYFARMWGNTKTANPTAARTPRAAAFTMARNESGMLPRWVDYYGRQLGLDNLFVFDDNSTDGSTDGLPCSVQRLPPQPWREPWGKARHQLVNGLARGCLAVYDVVVATDVDEFVVPDPARYDGLLDYFARNAHRPVMASMGLNVLHAPSVEKPLDPSQPVLSQRSFVKFAPVMCKPSAKRIPAAWMLGFHGIEAPFEIDRDLWLLHLKFHDLDALRLVARERHELHVTAGVGDKGSAWALDAEQLVTRQLRWVEGASGRRTPEFVSSEPDLSRVVAKRAGKNYRSMGAQLAAMKRSPLRRLPERFRGVF